MILAGLDIGTTGSKITLFKDTTFLDSFYTKYDYEVEDINLIDVNKIFEAILKMLKEVFSKYNSIDALGVTSFGETFVLLDKDDHILMNSYLYTSKEGFKEAHTIERKLTKRRLGYISGQIGDNMFSLPKLLYIKNNNKKIYKQIDKIMLIEDYIVYKLTKKRAIDYSLACRTLAFDINKKEFSDAILNEFNIKKELWSKPVKSGTFVGYLLDEYQKVFNLSKKVKIYCISHDQVSNTLGSGILKPYDAVDGNGTCECISVCYKKEDIKPFLYNYGYGVIPYLYNDLYLSYILNYSGGSLIDYVLKTYFPKDLEKYKENIYEFIELNLKDEISDVLVLPYFLGNLTPYKDKKIKGAILNLSLDTTKFDIYKATLESLCFEMKLNLDIFEENGIKINNLYASGGSSVNEYYLQLKADIFNKDIIQLENKDAGTLGCLILLGKEEGLFSSYEEGIKKIVAIRKVFHPNRKNFEAYKEKYFRYKKIYKCIRKV